MMIQIITFSLIFRFRSTDITSTISFPSTAHDSFQVSCERLDESYKMVDASSQIVLHIQFKANK